MAIHLFNTINFLLVNLFEKEEENLEKRKYAMVTKNMQLGGSSDGFRYEGTIYSQLQGHRSMGSYSQLNPTLLGDMQTIISDAATLAREKDRISQALTLVLRDCRSEQDMRDALPNCMKDLIPACAHLERTRPEAFTLEDNPRSYRQYMKLREKMDFYVASRLLY